MSEQPRADETLARFHEEHRGDTSLWESKPARIRVRRGGPSTVFSLRLAPEELTEIFQEAERQGLTTSEFIRRAALNATREGRSRDDAAVEHELESAQKAVEKALTVLRRAR